MLASKKILVIGGAGFIGSHVVDALLREPVGQVVIYDNFARGTKENLLNALKDYRCTIYPDGGDIRDIDLLDNAMKGMDYVVHLAAMWLLHCKDYPRTAFDVNINGTFNVLKACVRNKIKRLVFSSSASVYGDAIKVPMDEEHPFNNRNFYGATKIAGEAMCRAFCERYGLSFVGLRYMNVYGPRQDQKSAYTSVIPMLLNAIDAKQRPKINGDGSQSYDFVFVEDVARANVLALGSTMTDKFYNIGTGVQTTLRELVSILLEEVGATQLPLFIPYLNDDSRQFVNVRVGSTAAAAADLGFNYSTPLKLGIKNLVKWRSVSNE
jgi:UDP-glucose 4-epimerase